MLMLNVISLRKLYNKDKTKQVNNPVFIMAFQSARSKEKKVEVLK